MVKVEVVMGAAVMAVVAVAALMVAAKAAAMTMAKAAVGGRVGPSPTPSSPLTPPPLSTILHTVYE